MACHEGKSDRRAPGRVIVKASGRHRLSAGYTHAVAVAGREEIAARGLAPFAKGIGDVISPVSEGLEGEMASGMLSRQGAHLTSASRTWTTSSTAHGRDPGGLVGVAELLDRY
ncbi:hypothetical protein [Streptomyces sp. NPDC059076]|uniref:imine reductase family protein n=1 Tax=unclassified Streptomyces TaxID=2593676 RepID=UPI00369DAE9F